MTSRHYNQFCLVAQSLDVIGNRWSLLIVRELILGPRRYSDIITQLGTASTDIVTTRLRELETSHILTHGDRNDRRYQLTESGLALAPVLLGLSRWTLEHAAEGHMNFPEPSGDVNRRLLTLLALKARTNSFAPNAASFTLRVHDLSASASRHGDHYSITESETTHSDPTTSYAITFTTAGLGRLGIGGANIDQLVQHHDLHIPNPAAGAFLAELNTQLGELPKAWSSRMLTNTP